MYVCRGECFLERPHEYDLAQEIVLMPLQHSKLCMPMWETTLRLVSGLYSCLLACVVLWSTLEVLRICAL